MPKTLLAGKPVMNGKGVVLFESRSKQRCLRWADANVAPDWGERMNGEISLVDWAEDCPWWAFWRGPRYTIICSWREAL